MTMSTSREYEFFCGRCGIIGEPLPKDHSFFARCSGCGLLSRFFPVPLWIEGDEETIEERFGRTLEHYNHE